MKTIHQKYIYIFLAIIPVVISIIGLMALLGSPYTGLHFEQQNDKWYVKSIDNDSPASKYPEMQGKEVISIEGWKIRQYELFHNPYLIFDTDGYKHFWEAQNYFSQHIKVYQPTHFIFMNTASDIREAVIIPSKYPLTKLLLNGFYVYITILFLLLIGLIVVLKNTNDTKSVLFFIFTTGLSVYILPYTNYLIMDITYPYELLQTLTTLRTISVAVFIGSITHFLLIFPAPIDLFKNKLKYIIYTGYLFAFSFIFLYTMGLTKIASEISILSTVIAVLSISYQYISISDNTRKAQVRWLLYGFMLTLIVYILYIVPIAFFHLNLVHISIMVLALNIIPLSMAFAIMRYRLMDIDTLFDNTLIYSVTIGLLALIDIAVVYILTSNKIPLLIFKEPFPTIIAMWVIIFTYLPIRNKVRNFIKRLLKREIYDINEISVSYSRELIAANTLVDVVNNARNVIEKALHPKNIEIELFSSPQQLQPLISTDTGGALIPLSATTGTIGLITLGEKHSGRLYDRNDIKLLDTIANQTALAVESIFHREGMRRKEEENREEKERISKEIHDGIGSSLVQAKLLLHKAASDNNAIGEASNVIDNGIKEMRELIWVVEQDEQTLGDLVYHIEGKLEQAKNILNINIETDIEDENVVLTPAQKLNISRIVQESITNIIKHAQASRVDISFVQQHKEFMITVRDNGKGFDMSKTSSESYGLRNMRARAEKIGARFDISSEIGKGSEMKLDILL
jgi:signal transduction histidine kinase